MRSSLSLGLTSQHVDSGRQVVFCANCPAGRLRCQANRSGGGLWIMMMMAVDVDVDVDVDVGRVKSGLINGPFFLACP